MPIVTFVESIMSISWNWRVQHVFASSSSTGYTVVWDLRNKRVVALAYGGAGQVGIIGGGRRGMSDVAWHPDNVSCVRCALVPHPSHLNRLQDP